MTDLASPVKTPKEDVLPVQIPRRIRLLQQKRDSDLSLPLLVLHLPHRLPPRLSQCQNPILTTIRIPHLRDRVITARTRMDPLLARQIYLGR